MAAIEIKNLTKHFGNVKAVDGIDFSVEKGEIFGFLGPNGAGKTTTIRCMMDFIRPSRGTITIFGKDSHRDSVLLKKKIGYLSGNVRLYNKWTGRDHIEFVSQLTGGDIMADELIERLDFDASRKVKYLSSGNRQKLGVILAFMSRPELLVLDEPTMALDPLLQHEIYTLLRELTNNGTTVFMSSHNLAEVEKVCNRVGIIKEGKIAAIENIQTLKEKHIFTVQVFFTEAFDKSVFAIEGVSIKEELPHGLLLTIMGDINSLLAILSKQNVRDLSITHASLEEIFLASYK